MAAYSNSEQAVRNLNMAYFAGNSSYAYSDGNSYWNYFSISNSGGLSNLGCKCWKKNCIVAITMVFLETLSLQQLCQNSRRVDFLAW